MSNVKFDKEKGVEDILLKIEYNSNSKKTPDVDIVISYNDITYKNYEDIHAGQIQYYRHHSLS